MNQPSRPERNPEQPHRPLRVQGFPNQGGGGGLLSALVSAVVHILVIWLLIGITAHVVDPKIAQQVASFLMPATSKHGGGGGGGAGGAVALAERPAPVEPQPEPVVVKPPPPVEVPPVPPEVIPDPIRVETPPSTTTGAGTGNASSGSGGGSGGGAGTGTGTGTGSGIGPGSGGGTGGGKAVLARDPEPQHMILPLGLKIPKQYRKHRLTLVYMVDATGKPVSLVTEPEIEDKNFRKVFIEEMMGFLFYPGKDSLGTRVPMQYSTTITLPDK